MVGGDVAAGDFVLPGAGGVVAVGEQGLPVLAGGEDDAEGTAVGLRAGAGGGGGCKAVSSTSKCTP